MSMKSLNRRWSIAAVVGVLFTFAVGISYTWSYSNNSSNNNNSNNNSRNNNNSNGNNSNGSSYGGSNFTSMSGVALANGVLMKAVDDNGALDRVRMESAYQGIPGEMKKASPLRKVSLNRLEKAIQDAGGTVTEEMANLAGLERIENVFFYPETGDIVIAGPAEGWEPGIEASTVGSESGRPTLKLADLVVALRAYPAGEKSTDVIGCSIDPTDDGLVALQNYLKTQRQPNVKNDEEVSAYAEGIRDSLGLQDVKVWGISPKTNFAMTLIAADYRMKLIGIGLEEPPVAMTTYVEKSNPAQMAKNALVRWYFQPNYDCVIQTQDGLGIALTGDGVNLVGEDELVSATGGRAVEKKGKTNRASRYYTESFSKQFAKIAEKVPVYADLRNLIDMSVVAAWLQKENIYEKSGWKMNFFGDEKSYSVETMDPVQQAETAVNVIAHGQSTLSFPVGGGVLIQAENALSETHLTQDDGQVAEKREQVEEKMPENVWWWD